MDEFTRAVREMREAQRQYFETRSKAHLSVAKDWERKVDAMVAQRTPPEQPRQGTLFG